MSQHVEDPQSFATAEEVVAGVLHDKARGAETTARDVCTLLSDWGNSVSRQSTGQDIYGCEGVSIRVLRQDSHPLRFSAWHGTENVVCNLSAVRAGTVIWGVDNDATPPTVVVALRKLSGAWVMFRYQKTEREFLPDTTWLSAIEAVPTDRQSGRTARHKPRSYRRYS